MKHTSIPAYSKKQQVMQYLHTNCLAEAKAALIEMCRSTPHDPEVWLLFGAVNDRLGLMDEAVMACQKSIALQPGYAEAHIGLGNALKKQKKFDEAIAVYRKALAYQPRHHGIYNNIGNTLMSQGRFAEAAEEYRKALHYSPNFAEAHNNLGNAHKRQGNFKEATASYRRAVEITPDAIMPWNNLGNVLLEQGLLDDAAECYRKVLKIDPNFASAYNSLGNVSRARDRLDEAVTYYRQAVEVKPDFVEAHHNLGFTLQQQGKQEVAIASYRHALRLKPDYFPVHNNLGNALQELGRMDEAIACYRETLRLNPNYVEAYTNLGNALHDMGNAEAAIPCYHEALRIKPDYAEAHNNLGNAFSAQGKLDDAAACFNEALRIKPDYAEAQSNLAGALVSQGLFDAAVNSFRSALRIKPDFAAAHSNLLFILNFCATDPDEVFREHCQWAAQHAASMARYTAYANLVDPERRLKVGYVSPDLCFHSVAFFFESLLANHDRAIVESICYADVAHPDFFTARFQSLASQWRNIRGLPHERVAELIREDRIDILVDLAGHTAHNRMLVFARKPAPIQVSYLGYPNTTGLATIDYRLTDAIADPPGLTERFHTETLARLPRGFLCYRTVNDAPPVAPLPSIATGHITFGSFNVPMKISPGVVECWARILRELPGTRLILKNRSFADAATRERYQALFASQGIEAERLDLLRRLPNLGGHLELYSRLDIALDTFPYHGTTTTCEALWMGVPVITLAGQMHAGRVGVSLLSQVGLPELIAKDPEDYVARAVALAHDRERLTHLRQTLRPRMQASSLCNGPAFARDVEAAYREMWRKWCAMQKQNAFRAD